MPVPQPEQLPSVRDVSHAAVEEIIDKEQETVADIQYATGTIDVPAVSYIVDILEQVTHDEDPAVSESTDVLMNADASAIIADVSEVGEEVPLEVPASDLPTEPIATAVDNMVDMVDQVVDDVAVVSEVKQVPTDISTVVNEV